MDKDDHEPVDTFHHDVTLPDGTMFGTRRRDGEVSPAFLKPLKEGVPLDDDQELVSISRGNGCPRELTLKSLGRAKGPPKFTTPAYRSNFDGIFGAKRSHGIC